MGDPSLDRARRPAESRRQWSFRQATLAAAMSFDVMLWRSRAGSRRSRGFIYLVLAEGLPCDGVEPIDVDAIQRDLDQASPGWRTEDVGFAVDLSATSISVSLSSGGRGDGALEALRAVATRQGLTIFDPQGTISKKDRQAAAKYLESQEEVATQEQVGVWMRAAERGEADAMNELGNAYSWGEGIRANAGLAAQWHARAAAAGHALAMANLAECYRSGEGVARDPRLVAHWLEQAGARGNLEALVRLAELYRAGDGVPKDPAAARRVLAQASEKDGQVSVFMLAEMLEAGEGGTRDVDRAKELYGVALANRHPEARVRLRRLGVEV
jgi:TPR repeat protein